MKEMIRSIDSWANRHRRFATAVAVLITGVVVFLLTYGSIWYSANH